MIDALPLLLGDDGYQISRSVRLRSSASAFFSRTPASAGNRRTWTWSGWVKRGLGSAADDRMLFSGTTNGTSTIGGLFFNGGGESLRYIDITTPATFQTNVTVTPVYRDFSAWYHIVLAVDTTQATAANRIRFFVNGVEVTTFATTVYPSQNADTFINAAQQHRIGTYPYSTSGPFDGYLTDINFIDGQALTPAAFGETDAITGVWKPRRYTGTYGTNGFFLNFSDPSAATAAAIGADRSGNGNNWTPNNISVTAGVTYDSMLDVPTPWADGGNGRGNYCVLNPLAFFGTATPTNSNGNLTSSRSSGLLAYGSMGVSSGQYYWEIRIDANGSQDLEIGVTQGITGINNTAGAYGWGTKLSRRWDNGSLTSSSIGTATVGDIVGIALDLTGSTFTVFKNGVQLYQTTGVVAGTYFPAIISGGAGGLDTVTANFGQRPFAYTPPTGFRALNTQNLPEPTIVRGNRFMDARLYTGNGSTQSITGMSFAPDLVWTKSRSGAVSHGLFDTVRGAGKALFSNATNAEFDYGTTTAGELYQFTSDGFNLGSFGNFNANGTTYVAWQWREGATQGFDIVTFNTQSSGVGTISHNLGVAPSMIIIKYRSGTSGWPVYHSAVGNTRYLTLNTTTGSTVDSTYWNNTSPTSTAFTLGTAFAGSLPHVAYLFSEVAGFSRFGSYTGNGSADGPFVFCGFRPRYVMVKRTDSSPFNWIVLDTARSQNNVAQAILYPNIANAEDTITLLDFTSNGFKIRTSDTGVNANGGTYIFAAFAENPFKYSLAR